MASLHPTLLTLAETRGAQRELDVLRQLQRGLPDGFDIFHSVEWSGISGYGTLIIGEADFAVVTPAGLLVLIEVKSGPVRDDGDGALRKAYRDGRTKEIDSQLGRQHRAMQDRLQKAGLAQVPIEQLLVLPDHHLRVESVAVLRERTVDQSAMPTLCDRIMALERSTCLSDDARVRLLAFLNNEFEVVLDVATRIGHVQEASRRLASGLATWVPQTYHAGGVYRVEATAGAGKTQLALRLLHDATDHGRRAAYVCFNRALADHMARQVPPGVEAVTLDQFCVEQAQQAGEVIDFASGEVFKVLRQRMAASPAAPRWELLVVDEMQDLAPDGVVALRRFLRPGGALYLLGDVQQSLYASHAHAWPEAVHIRCQDNFRSPRRIVQTLNALQLCERPVQPRSAYVGEPPGFTLYDADWLDAALQPTAACLQRLLAEGVAPSDIALLSYSGLKHSRLLAQAQIAGLALRKTTGAYNERQQAIWTEGELLADTVMRFKGQSAPVVVLSEVDFDVLDETARRRLFVGFTRAQYRLECVLSTRAEAALARALRNG